MIVYTKIYNLELNWSKIMRNVSRAVFFRLLIWQQQQQQQHPSMQKDNLLFKQIENQWTCSSLKQLNKKTFYEKSKLEIF